MKAVIKIWYKDYILPANKALEILEVLESADLWEAVYHSAEGNEGGRYSYHVWSNIEEAKPTHFELVSDDLHRMAKLAGRPEEK